MTLELPWKRKNLTDVWTWPHITLLTALGWWAEEKTIQNFRQFANVWKIFTIGCTISLAVSIMMGIIMKFSTRDITSSLFAIYSLGPAAFSSYKAIQTVRHRKSLKAAMNIIDELTSEAIRLEDIEVIKKRMFRTWIIFIITMALINIAVFHWMIRPLFIVFIFGERTSIVDGWPAYMETGTQFYITYIYQLIIGTPSAFGYIMFDSIFFCISECILCHFFVFQRNIERVFLNKHSVQYINLKQTVKTHLKLLRACSELKTASEGVLITLTLVTVVSWCFGLYILTMGENISLNIILNTLEGNVVIGVFLYLLCSYSHEITLQCRRVGTSAYMSNWMEAEERAKKSLIIIMKKTESPTVFGGFMHISLDTFIYALKTTFSYYNFLLAVMGTSSKKF